MIAYDNREAVKALPPPLRKLLESAAITADQLDERRSRHDRGHECAWFVWPAGNESREFCPVSQALMAAWHPLYVFAKCLEYFLVGGEIPAGGHMELIPLCREPGCVRPVWVSGPRCKECVDAVVDRNERLEALAAEMGPTR
jgi:hypothetical protein